MPKTPRRRQSVSLPEEVKHGGQSWRSPLREPPDGLPIYRLITGKDDATFCHRVSEALELGYCLHGSPAVTFNGTEVIAAQALLWPPTIEDYDDIPF